MKKTDKPRKLEDCEPGATREEVHNALRLVAQHTENSKKKSQKSTSQSEQA